MVSLVILVAIESPNTADHDQRADAIVPKIAEKMKTQVGPRVRSLEPDVIVNDSLRQVNASVRMLGPGCRGVGMIAQAFQCPFHVEDRAIVWRKVRRVYFRGRV